MMRILMRNLDENFDEKIAFLAIYLSTKENGCEKKCETHDNSRDFDLKNRPFEKNCMEFCGLSI